jgi:hypothetical protein
MKRNYLKITLLAVMGLALTYCSKDDPAPAPDPIPEITDTQLEADLKIDLSIDAINADVAMLYGTSPASKGVSVEGFQNACDVSPTPGFMTEAGVQYITLEYDFGTTGCTQSNGNVLKGKVKIAYNSAPTIPTIIMFTDFYHNEILVNGRLTSVKEDNDGKPKVTNTQDLTVTFPNLGVFKRVGEATRIFIKGYDTKDNTDDDEYSTTGNWKTTFPDDTQNEVIITKPLISLIGCVFKKHVEGTLQFNRKGNTGTLDFGDGKCGAVWTLTRTGKPTIQITRGW